MSGLIVVDTDDVSNVRPEDEEAVRGFAVWKHRPKQSAARDPHPPTPQQVYAGLMKSAFAPALRAAGLRGSAGRFELPSEVYWAQLGFQKSAYSDGQEVRFTVNLSSIRRDEWEAQAAVKPYLGQKPTPNTLYGAWADQVRIGVLANHGQDKWWRIVRGGEADDVRDDALKDLLTYGVPWLRERVV